MFMYLVTALVANEKNVDFCLELAVIQPAGILLYRSEITLFYRNITVKQQLKNLLLI